MKKKLNCFCFGSSTEETLKLVPGNFFTNATRFGFFLSHTRRKLTNLRRENENQISENVSVFALHQLLHAQVW